MDVLSGVAPQRAEAMRAALAETLPADRWRSLCALLTPDDPLSLHRQLHRAAHRDHSGPMPIWYPDAPARITEIIGERSFADGHRWSVTDPDGYWRAILAALQIPAPAQILRADEGAESARWLPGARLNAAWCCLTERDDDAAAVIWREEGSEQLQSLTIGALRARVVALARSLRAAGFSPGDAIAIDMPMTVESVIIYLGIVAMGGVVVSIADSFSAPEIATRLQVSGAVGIFTQDVIVRGQKRLPLYVRVCEAGAPRAVVLPGAGALTVSLRPTDQSWSDFLAGDPGGRFSPHIADADQTSNILFSSGTTATPKAIPWTHITPIKAAADGLAHQDIRPGDVVAWPTNLGWMMGPWLIYASLLNRATIALYQGSPTGRGFTAFVQDARVTMLGVVPSLVRAWRSADAVAGLDWSAIRCFSSTGEVSSPQDMRWLVSRAGYRPVIEYCGGTEIGGGYITGSLAQPQVLSAFSTPAMGCGLLLLDARGEPAEQGEVALIAPMLGASNRLLNRDHHAVYFAGMPAGPQGEVLRRHGDQMVHLGGGYFRAQGRVDDTMNLGGIKVSSAEIERACAVVEGVAEIAAIATSPADGGPSQLILVVVAASHAPAAEVQQHQLQQAIRDQLNPLFKVHRVVRVHSLPRTASGKVMRRVLREQHGS